MMEGIHNLKVLVQLALILLGGCMCSWVQDQQPTERPEMNTALMEATFKLEGTNKDGQPVIGTGFLMGRPFQNNPKKGQHVLITAAHLFDEMTGPVITVHARRRIGVDDWARVPFQLTIRADNAPLFVRLPDADVAAMYVNLPDGVRPPLLSTNMLADDEVLKKYEIHPGDEVRCLGYPLSLESNQAGFPILRSGKIASYPLVPTDRTKTFLFDFKVFKGNSGGPVYFVDVSRSYGNAINMGEEIHFLIGLVSGEALFDQKIMGPYSAEIRRLQLDLGIIVHASQIRKAIDLLPVPDTLP